MKKKIVLDLDQTLICTVDRNATLRQLHRQGVVLNMLYIDSVDGHITFFRPHLFQFLDYIFSHFDVSVFTAAERGYAKIIVDTIFANYHLDAFLSRENYIECLIQTGQHKYIDYIAEKIPGYDRTNTRIIDDTIDIALSNPHNIIPIAKFEVLSGDGTVNVNCMHDTELLRIMNQLKMEN